MGQALAGMGQYTYAGFDLTSNKKDHYYELTNSNTASFPLVVVLKKDYGDTLYAVLPEFVYRDKAGRNIHVCKKKHINLFTEKGKRVKPERIEHDGSWRVRVSS